MSNNLDRFKVPRTKTMPLGRVDLARVDATTEAQIRQQKRSDTLEAKADAAAYVRGIREQRHGLSPSAWSPRPPSHRLGLRKPR
jgi:hypothetical protein